MDSLMIKYLTEHMESIRPKKDNKLLLIELELIAEETAKKIKNKKDSKMAEICIKIGMYEAVNKFYN